MLHVNMALLFHSLGSIQSVTIPKFRYVATVFTCTAVLLAPHLCGELQLALLT